MSNRNLTLSHILLTAGLLYCLWNYPKRTLGVLLLLLMLTPVAIEVAGQVFNPYTPLPVVRTVAAPTGINSPENCARRVKAEHIDQSI
jgi:hypothetical protein